MRDTLSYYLSPIALNYSEACQPMEEPDINSLMNFYHLVGLILGPINAISSGLCVHIFKHPVWKKSAMSAILKSLSIFELCLGICLFFTALLYLIDKDGSDLLADSDSRILRDDQAYIKRIVNYCFTVAFSRGVAVFQISRNWSVVLLAAYRYDRICRPIGTGTTLPKRRISSIMIIVFILSSILVAPRLFESGIVVCRTDGSVAGDKNMWVDTTHYQVIYIGAVMFIVQSGGPVICVCVLSAFVIRLIIRRRRLHETKMMNSGTTRLLSQYRVHSQPTDETWKQNQGSDIRNGASPLDQQHPTIATIREPSPSENVDSPTAIMADSDNDKIVMTVSKNVNLSGALVGKRPPPSGDKLIFAVSITFFVLETPAFFSKILHPYLKRDYGSIDQFFSVIANLLIYLDSTLNAIVYMASNPTFRLVVKKEVVRIRTKLSTSETSATRTIAS